ncbi:RlpA-like double-psi beta-barrel-protein domain-containing protein-containing protein [Flammula alnicola]|nr:RlpA-like double-psi beta-barrel-protein domain-containing protein-containing protein [Flammula alnicola]
MSFAKCLVLFLSLAASANALATPHVVRHPSHHRAIAARVAAPAPVDVPALSLRKRQNTQRCRQRSSSVQAPSSTHPASSANILPVSKPTTSAKAAPPPAPTTSTKKATPTPAPAPAPATTHVQQAAPAPAPATTKQSSTGSSSNLPSFMVGTQTGQGTFYATGLGACGITNTDTDHIAAVSHLLFDNFPGYNGVNPNSNPLCGRTVTAHYQGKSVTVALTDRCTGCAVTDLDFSPSAFNQLADFAVGRISGMTWTWN